MKKIMSLMVEIDEATLSVFEQHFIVHRFSKAAPGSRGEVMGEDDVVRHLERVKPEVAVLELEPVTARTVAAAAPELQLIACSRATPTNIDIAACSAKGVVVTNAPGRNANAVVEMTIGFVICLARFIPQTYHRILTRDLTLSPGTPLDHKDILWQNPALKMNPYVLYRGIEIEGRILGLTGFGIIGKLLAPKAAALGMRVLVHDPFVSADVVAAHGATKADSFAALLREADFVSLHAKPTPETRGMMGWEQFTAMKRDAYFINTSRGALVKQDDLVRALREKVIAGAALDVYEAEPLYDDSPLLGLDNLIMTPHIGGATRDMIRHQSRILLANVNAYLEGNTPPNVVGR